jgi:hypothetical protein
MQSTLLWESRAERGSPTPVVICPSAKRYRQIIYNSTKVLL